METCICAEEIVDRGEYPCGHSFCLECVLKHRVLMKDFNCSYCRKFAETVAIVSPKSTADKAHIGFKAGSLKVESRDLISKLSDIMSYTCSKCGVKEKSLKLLKQHLNTHESRICDICVKNELKFSQEYQLFTPKSLQEHIKSRHIRCKYCKTSFYDSQQFNKHCKTEHMGCLVCERIDNEHLVYYKDYDALYEHYRDRHYMCMVQQCLDDKHIVFGTRAELNAHMVSAHRGMIRNASTFDIRSGSDDKDMTSRSGLGRRNAGSNAGSELGNEEDDTTSANTDTPLSSNKNQHLNYDLRLSIAANHDEEKINAIKAANKTFINGKVPANVFIITYESVLKTASKSEITSLLTTFSKANNKNENSKLPAFSALDFTLYRRREEEEANLPKLNKKNEVSKAPVMAPTPVKKSLWSANLNASGRVPLKNLPSLGKPKVPTPLPMHPQARGPTVTYKHNMPSQPALSSLPKLKSPGVNIFMKDQPQIRHGFAAKPLPGYTPPTAPISKLNVNNPKPQVSAPTFTHSSKPQTTKLNIRSLPTLPKQETVKSDPKKKKNILRIV